MFNNQFYCFCCLFLKSSPDGGLTGKTSAAFYWAVYFYFAGLIPKYATIMVISSIMPCSFYHLWTDWDIKRFAAPSQFRLFIYYGAVTILVISMFDKRSQRPSDAITIALSCGVRWLNTYSSGSAVTPTLPATRSPILLVMASPGTCLFLSQTLGGPKN